MTPLFYLQQYGDLFEVRVTTTIAVNAWEGRLVLPSDLKVQSVSYGAGIGDVWQAPPAISGRNIDFTGGRTAGFTGDGLLFRFTAAPPAREAQLIRFDAARTALYAADGQGTRVPADLRPLTVNAADLLTVSSSARAADLAAAPQPFEIVVVRDPEIFDGRQAIIFAAADPGSGIDHYEVKEHTYRGVIDWHRAESPYLVDADTTMILVKAVGRTGNSHVESVVLRQPGPAAWQAGTAAAVLLLAAAVYLIYRWKRRR